MIEFEGLTFNNEDEAINFLRVENARLKNRFARAEQEYRFRIREFKENCEKEVFKLNEQIKNMHYTANFHKIKFCIIHLEKVKADLVNNVSPVKLSYTDYVQEVFNTLNNQIEELKKE